MTSPPLPNGVLPLSETRSRELRDLAENWQKKRGNRLAPTRLDFDPLDLRDVGGYQIFIHANRASHILSASSIGVIVRRKCQPREVEGRDLAEFVAPGFLALLWRVVLDAEPLFVSGTEVFSGWLPALDLIALPLSDDGQQVDGLLIACRKPDNSPAYSAGLTRTPSVTIALPETKTGTPQLDQLLAQWYDACEGREMPAKSFVDPFALKYILGHLVLFDVEQPGNLIRYRLSGTQITDRVGFDLTGMRVVDIPDDLAATEVQVFTDYCIQLRKPVFATSYRLLREMEFGFVVLVLPLSNDGKTVSHLLAGQLYDIDAPRWRRDQPRS